MFNPIHVAEGAINLLLDKNVELSQQRMEICLSCPLYSSRFGGLCNNKLWYDKESGDVTTKKTYGYVNGCGCILKMKTKVPAETCPAGKW